MKWQCILLTFTGGAIALTASVIFIQPTHAQSVNIRCQITNNQPTTIINREGEEAPYINWYRVFPIPKARQLCQQVTERLQRYSRNGQNFALSTGQVQGGVVVCFARTSNDGCNADSERLFDPYPTKDPDRFLSELFPENLYESSSRFYPNREMNNRGMNILGFPIPRWKPPLF